MRLQTLLDKIATLPDEPAAYLVYLATPEPTESGETNVELIPVVKVEWDAPSQSIRLYPELADADDDTLPTLQEVMDAFPPEWEVTPGTRLQVQVPIVRSVTDARPTSFVDVHDMAVGLLSMEFWLLLKPRDEYPQADLPT